MPGPSRVRTLVQDGRIAGPRRAPRQGTSPPPRSRPHASETRTTGAAEHWDLYTESLRLRRHTGAAANDPFWDTINRPDNEDRTRTHYRVVGAPPGNGNPRGTRSSGDGRSNVELRLLNGDSLTLRASLHDPIRRLRMAAAEHFGCCVGQVRLLIDVPLAGLVRHPALLDRVAEHLGCSPAMVSNSVDGRAHVTLSLADRRSLHDYGCRDGGHQAGHLCVILCDSDAVGHVLHA